MKGEEDRMYQLKQAFYELKQSSLAWKACINIMKRVLPNAPISMLFILKKKNKNIAILVIRLYVDDLLFQGNNE